MIRLIALDLDGTLLNSALKVSERNGEAVRRALESGIKVVLATTRWYLLAKRTADRLGIDTPLVCKHGAIVKRPDGGELLHLRLDQELAREATALADERRWETFTTIEDATYMRPRPGIIAERLAAGLRLAERHADEGPRAGRHVRRAGAGLPRAGRADGRGDGDGRLGVRPLDAPDVRSRDRHEQRPGRGEAGRPAHRARQRRRRRRLGDREVRALATISPSAARTRVRPAPDSFARRRCAPSPFALAAQQVQWIYD